ncbi:MAG: hypothetical protein J7M16_07090 [Anaerolineae bacterium]|nr:hypothetical protein [Anaerolineae bacterium]
MRVPASKLVRYRAAGGVVVDGDRVLVLRRPGRGDAAPARGRHPLPPRPPPDSAPILKLELAT